MKSFTYVIKNSGGIHARPASLLLMIVKKFESQITLTKENNCILVTGIIKLIGLGVIKGDKVEIAANGGDEETAIKELKIFFDQNL